MQGIIRVFQETFAFFAALVKPSAKSIADNRGLFAVSVILAFTIWVFVTDSENPTRTQNLPVDIPVQPVNVPDDVAIAADIIPVRVQVTVADEVFDDLEAGDFEATVDLTNYGVGTHDDVPVKVVAQTRDGGLRVNRVLPEEVTVVLAPLTSKAVPVEISVSGRPPTGFSMGVPEHQSTVLVTGPQEEVDKVAQATATIDVSARTESVDQALTLSPRTSRGFLVQRVNLDPSFVNITIDIEQEQFTRSVAVNVVTEGTPAEGYNLGSVDVDPPTIVVRGDESFIDGVFAIDTQPIDIEGADEDIEQTVSLDLPEGVTVPGGSPVVTVSINIEPGQAEFSFTVPLDVRNLGTGLSIQGGVPSVQVVMQGPYPVLSEIEVADIRASIDLSTLATGTHTITVIVANLPGVLTARSVPAAVEIVLQ